MKRTTIYLEPDLELRLKHEARRQKRPMADLIRDALRRHLGDAPRRRPPGAGAFASGTKNTASRVDAVLSETRFGEKT